MRKLALLFVVFTCIATAQEMVGTGANIMPDGPSGGDTGKLRFFELLSNGNNSVGFQAPDNITADLTWILPDADGTAGQCITTNGSLQLAFQSCGGGGGGGDVFTNVSNVFTASAQHIQITGGPAEFWLRTNWNQAGAYTRFFARTYPGAGNTSRGMILGGVAYGGTLASPTATLAGATLFEFQGGGYDGTTERTDQGSMYIETTSTWTPSSNPSRIRFATTPVGSLTRADRLIIDADITTHTHIIPSANNTLALGADPGDLANARFFSFGRILDVYSNRLRIGVQQLSGNFLDYHRWEFGTTAHQSVIENNGGVAILFFDSSVSPQVVRPNAHLWPNSNNTFDLGQSGLRWRDAFLAGTLNIASSGGQTITFDKTSGGSSYSLHMPAAAPTTNNRILEFDSSGNAIWINTPSGGGSFTCDTAGNCVNINGTQTITGAKTLANTLTTQHVIPGAHNTYSMGGIVSGTTFAYSVGYLRETQTQIFKVGTFSPPFNSFLESHRWIPGVGLNQSQISNNSGAAVLSFASNLSPAMVTVHGNFTVNNAATLTGGLATGSSSNSTLYVGSSGNLYNRVLGGSSTSVSCAGVTSGWTAISTDNYVVVCRSGTRYRASLAAF